MSRTTLMAGHGAYADRLRNPSWGLMPENPILQPDPKTPEVHRLTPFEHDRVAEPEQKVINTVYQSPAGVWLMRAGSSELQPAIPSWMAGPQSRGVAPRGARLDRQKNLDSRARHAAPTG